MDKKKKNSIFRKYYHHFAPTQDEEGETQRARRELSDLGDALLGENIITSPTQTPDDSAFA